MQKAFLLMFNSEIVAMVAAKVFNSTYVDILPTFLTPSVGSDRGIIVTDETSDRRHYYYIVAIEEEEDSPHLIWLMKRQGVISAWVWEGDYPFFTKYGEDSSLWKIFSY